MKTKQFNLQEGKQWQLRKLLLLALLAMVLPQGAWAADESDLDKVYLEDKSYYVVRSNDDWLKFQAMVKKAAGEKDVNVILDADITVSQPVGMSNCPYRGTFHGNGHKVTLNIDWGNNDYAAMFPIVKDVTVRDLYVDGTVRGGQYSSSIVGTAIGQPTITIERIRVSANVYSSKEFAGGIIGLSNFASVVINDCMSYGAIYFSVNSNIKYAGAIIGMGYSPNWTMHRVYEYVSFGSGIHFMGFSFYGPPLATTSIYAWGTNSNSTLCLSRHNWSEVNADCRNIYSADVPARMNAEKEGSWIDDGIVHPVMDVYKPDVSFETYDMVPGTKSGEEGKLKIPFSCDQAVKWIDASYIDENGNTKKLERITLPKNTYAGFITVPATEAHKNLKFDVKLYVGSVSVAYNANNDAVMHNPRLLRADMLGLNTLQQQGGKANLADAGAVLLKWTTQSPKQKDVISSDQFTVLRSLTGKVEDFEAIGSVILSEQDSVYNYKDSTLIGKLTADMIDKSLGIPLVRYCVVRGAAQQLWGLSHNPAAAFAQPQMATLELLKPKEARTEWIDKTERKVKVIWDYEPNDQSLNYVWDSRAEMRLEVMTYRRDGSPIDTVRQVLSDDQIQAGAMELTLNRSCALYDLHLVAEAKESPIGKGQGEIFYEINSTQAYTTYATKVYNKGKGLIDKAIPNAIMTADIRLFEDEDATHYLGYNFGTGPGKPFSGNFNGNGHTFTIYFPNAVNLPGMAPIMHAANGAVICNLTTAGSMEPKQLYASGLVGYVDEGMVFIENCRTEMSIETLLRNTKAAVGGVVGYCAAGASLMVNTTQSAYHFGPRDASVGGASGFVGECGNNAFTLISNSYANRFAEYNALKSNYGKSYSFVGSDDLLNTVVQDSKYTYDYDVYQGMRSSNSPKNWGWSNGAPAVEQKQFTKADTLHRIGVTMPVGRFYYENRGHIDQNSLEVQIFDTSVLLIWKNVDDEPVDYYEVWRHDLATPKDSLVLVAGNLTDMQYEDKTTSPIRQYEYFVRGVTSCEGLKYDDTKRVSGMCVQTATVEGFLQFPDGTGIPGKRVSTSVDGVEKGVVTDESGFFRLSGLPYVNNAETTYRLTASLEGFQYKTVTFTTEAGGNVVSNFVLEYANSVKLSGYVQYEGTSIPVAGVSFMVDGYEVRTAAGKVTTDHEGKFTFRILKGDHDSIQAVKDNHTFWRDGFYHENDDDPDTKKAYSFNTDKAGLMFYDTKRVKLIGRIAGGKDQAALPLGNSLSRNNLGDELQMVLTLEGDNASRLVWDIKDRNKKKRDEVFKHKAHDTKYDYHTSVHTTLNRMVVTPDVHTGEYEVMLPPVKWKIQQITAKGYPTLFQDGQVGDVIDLSDSVVLHKDVVTGSWKNHMGKEITSVVEEYHAKYNRIYHSPVIIEYKQLGHDPFSFFGDRYYSFKNVDGTSEKLSLAYGVRKKDWPKGKRDSLETAYTFGYPVFSIDKKYGIKISALERYYYNNNTKSDTIDVIRLSGGEVTIHNGMISSTHKEVVELDSVGEALYSLEAAQTPYLLTGKDALHTVSMTLLMDGTHYEAEPLNAYILNVKPKSEAKDIISYSTPQLIDILRDPPGGLSKATLSKGSTLKYSYTMDLKWSAGLGINFSVGSGVNSFTGVVVAPMGGGAVGGVNNNGQSSFGTSIDLVWSGSGQRAFNYTMTAKEDISTSTDSKLVGANGDLYMGVVQNIVLKPATAIRAIPDSVFRLMDGLLKGGRTVEIAQGRDERDSLIHLVRDEVVTYGPKITSDFVYSQDYLVRQLMPALTEHILSLMYTGTEAEAQAQADATGKPVYLSLVAKDDPDFGSKYKMIVPKGAPANTENEVARYQQNLLRWVEMIAQNEKEKLEATELVKNFDIDGASSLSYSESFTSDYSVANSFVSPITAGTAGYFENAGDGFAGAAAIVGPMVAKILGNLLKGSAGKTTGETGLDGDEGGLKINVEAVGFTFNFSLNPAMSLNVTPKDTESKSYSRTESFSIGMYKKNHLNFDVYRVKTKTDNLKSTNPLDVFYNNNFYDMVDYDYNRMKDEVDVKKFTYARSFVYRTRAGATCRPWENERRTLFHEVGTLLDERTKKIENPVIKMDKQSLSGVPYGEPARFKLYLSNESEQPEAIFPYFDLYQNETANPNGAKMVIDGVPLTGNPRTIEVRPGMITEKTLEVYAGEKFDYEGLKVGLISQGDIDTYQEVAFDVHYIQTAGSIAITSPGDKWIMNCDAPFENGKGWYLPIIISGFDKNQHNFDHIEFQYKETTRGDDYWTNLCGYYADSTLYRAASGTKAMIPENGNIVTRFFGEGQEMEKGYDLRAVLFCRNGNSFLTSESKVLSGVKDTRRPQLFGTPIPKSGVLGAGENIVFDFSEDIEYNYLQATTNFEVKGETNETAIQEAPSLQFGGNGYAQTETRRNFSDKDVTIEVMIKPDEVNHAMPIFSHGSDGKQLQLWLTEKKHLRAVVIDADTLVAESNVPVKTTGFKRVALVLDNHHRQLRLYSDNEDLVRDSVTYTGYGPLTFGFAMNHLTNDSAFYKGRMLQGRVWNRALDLALLRTYGDRLLTGYELGLTDYYPMNEGVGDRAADFAQGAHLKMNGASWAQPRGMSLRLDESESRPAGAMKGRRLQEKFFQRDDEQDYTLMFWFKTTDVNGSLLSNGSGQKTDEDAYNKFFIGFEDQTLKYRTNGNEYDLGDKLCDDAWHHYAMTVNRMRNVASIYIDNTLKAQFSTDSLGGMTGTRFYLGNMVWQDSNDPALHEKGTLTGYIDGLSMFEQALPITLIERYTRKSLGGTEKGLIVYLDFDHQERQKTGELSLQPYVLNKKVKYDIDGKPTDQRDSVFVDAVSEMMKRVDRNIGAPMQAFEELRNLNFSFVGRNNQLLVNIDELDARINKQNIYVTLADIPDKNGNFMKSPATECFFINRNPLVWGTKVLKETIPANRECYFTLDVINNGGKAHTYLIQNLPRWMTVDKMSNVVDAQGHDKVTLSISKDMNVGTYDQIIYLTDENGLSEPLALELTIEGEDPYWEVDKNLQRYSMNVVGQVFVGNTLVTDSHDKVAAFDENGRCMGVNNIKYDPATGRSMVYMTVFNDKTEATQLFFRLWHYTTGKVMQLTASPSIDFIEQSIVGSVTTPVRMTADDLYMQKIYLEEGWNWLSFNVYNAAFDNIPRILSGFPWQEGDILTDDSSDLTLIFKKGKWASNSGKDISTLKLSQKISYRVKVKEAQQVDIWGTIFKRSDERTIVVKHKWNNIGYTPMVNLPVSTALADYFDEASNGDVVKSQHEFAMFVEDGKGSGEWFGTLEYMMPGEGYMLYRNKKSEATFKYPYFEPGSTFIDTHVTNSGKHAPARFATNMNVVAEAVGVEVQEGDKLLAFANGELVGSEELMRDLFFLTIEGDVEAPLSFAIERNGEIIAATQETMTYEANGISGQPGEPTKISFVAIDQLPSDGWYSLQGMKLNKQPKRTGVYIRNGKKQVVK